MQPDTVDLIDSIALAVLYAIVVAALFLLPIFLFSSVRGLRRDAQPRKTGEPAEPLISSHPPPTSRPELSIFISYRRDDSAGYAGRLYDRLRQSFAKERLFMDIDNIPPGEDFVAVLENAITACNVVLVLIGKQWLTIPDKHDARRLDNPHDFVRLEVATALARNIRVIPVLVRGATMPSANALPPDLQAMARRQAFEIRDDDFHHDVDRLIAAIRRD